MGKGDQVGSFSPDRSCSSCPVHVLFWVHSFFTGRMRTNVESCTSCVSNRTFPHPFPVGIPPPHSTDRRPAFPLSIHGVREACLGVWIHVPPQRPTAEPTPSHVPNLRTHVQSVRIGAGSNARDDACIEDEVGRGRTMVAVPRGTVHAFRRCLNRHASTSASNKVSLEAIRALRATSGAPVAEVKAALQSSHGDPERAMEELRKRGVVAAGKKADRNAAEGVVAVHVDASGRNAALVEINTETDFAARTDTMQQLARKIARAASGSVPGPVDVSQGWPLRHLEDGTDLQDAFAEAKASIRENVQWRRGHKLLAHPPRSVVGQYVHNQVGQGVGDKAALVVLEAADGSDPNLDVERMTSWADQVAMHVVAMRPRHLDASSVPDEELRHEEEILHAQLKDAGKPPGVVEKIVQGRLRKFYEEHCLMQQRFVLDDQRTVSRALSDALGPTGPSLSVLAFVRYERGEGLSRSTTDFAREVAEVLR